MKNEEWMSCRRATSTVEYGSLRLISNEDLIPEASIVAVINLLVDSDMNTFHRDAADRLHRVS